MGRSVRRLLCAVTLATAGLIASPPAAWAGDATSAETLFQEGLTAMKKGDYPLACEAFGDSNKADPSPGTQINLALCFEKQKKWASAWTWYRSAAGLAHQRGQGEREKLAQAAVARLEPKLHYIVVAAAEPPPDLVVKRDGVEIAIALGGKELPVPIDPGEHTIEASAPGKKPWSTVVRVSDEPGTERVAVPKLEDAPPEPSAVQSGSPSGRPGEAPSSTVVVVGNDGSTQRTIGVITGGAGLVAGAAAVAVYFIAKDQASSRDHWRKEAAEAANAGNADDADRFTASANDYSKKADLDQILAITLGVGAGVLVATGAVLYFTAPKAAPKTGGIDVFPLAGPGHAGLGLSGTF